MAWCLTTLTARPQSPPEVLRSLEAVISYRKPGYPLVNQCQLIWPTCCKCIVLEVLLADFPPRCISLRTAQYVCPFQPSFRCHGGKLFHILDVFGAASQNAAAYFVWCFQPFRRQVDGGDCSALQLLPDIYYCSNKYINSTVCSLCCRKHSLSTKSVSMKWWEQIRSDPVPKTGATFFHCRKRLFPELGTRYSWNLFPHPGITQQFCSEESVVYFPQYFIFSDIRIANWIELLTIL